MTDEPSDSAQIRPAHPAFAAHFRRPIYHPDHPDFRDEIPPFGSDEGFDEVYGWSERAEELLAHPTLRYMIADHGVEPDAFVADLAETDQVDVDDILIGSGFTLLRYTGQIDDEGRRWLEQAVIRQRDRYGNTDQDYALLLGDLQSFRGR